MNPSEMRGRLDYGADNRFQSNSCRWDMNYTYGLNREQDRIEAIEIQ